LSLTAHWWKLVHLMALEGPSTMNTLSGTAKSSQMRPTFQSRPFDVMAAESVSRTCKAPRVVLEAINMCRSARFYAKAGYRSGTVVLGAWLRVDLIGFEAGGIVDLCGEDLKVGVVDQCFH
jgi:hypothetical protein